MENTERRRKLGKAIREERTSQGISQRKLAHMVGHSSHTYIVEIEHGTKSIGFDMVCAIADALDVDVSYFFVQM